MLQDRHEKTSLQNELAAAVVRQLAIVMNNLALAEEEHPGALDMSGLEQGPAIHRLQNPGPEPCNICEQLADHFDCRSMYIAVLDDTDQALDILLFCDHGRRLEPFTCDPEELAFASWILRNGRPLLSVEVEREDEGLPGERIPVEPTARSMSYFGIPLMSNESIFGVMAVERTSARSFDAEERRQLLLIGQLVAGSLENARLRVHEQGLVQELKETRARWEGSEGRAVAGELAAGLAHEISNPLTAVLGHSQLLLQSRVTSDEILREELGAINAAAQRIARIVKEFARIADMEAVRRQQIDFRDVLRDAVLSLGQRVESRGLTLALNLPSRPLWVDGSRTLLKHVLVNVLVNAVEAMPNEGAVQVAAGLDYTGVFCTIVDTGKGIGAENLERVFEPGFSTKVPNESAHRAGMGLYTAKRILQNYGGKISVESRPGQGTTARIVLPCVAPTAVEES